MSATSDTRLGTTLAGYRIERLLGRGGMSVVYLAEDMRLGRRVALKLIAADLCSDPRFRERFLRESRIAASLDHSNVIPIYEAGEADGALYIAMRYVDGTELKSVIARDGALDPDVALDLLGQAAGALDVAHARGLVHRDVKPANVLLADEDGSGPRHVYLADFGLTKQASSESGLTETGQFVGTADYIAPEQIEHGDVGAWTDVYALACVLFECLTGEPPFRRDALMSLLWAHVHDPPPAASERRSELPRELDAVIARGMAKAPRERYPTCGALVAAAREALGFDAPTKVPRTLGRISRRPALVLAGLALAAAAAAAALGVLLLGRGEDAAAEPTTTPGVDSLQRIDPATGLLAATVPLGSSVRRVAVGGRSVWALDVASRYRRVDRATNSLAGTGTTAGVPSGIAVGFGSVWIANRDGPTATTGTVTQVDPRSGRATRVIPIPVSQRVPNEPTFADVVADPASGALWVAAPFELALKRIRPRLGSLVATVPVGATTPRRLAVGGDAVWATTAFGAVRVDPARNTVTASVRLPFDPRDIAVGGGAVWIANGTGNSIWVVDPATARVVDRIAVGVEPMGVAVGAGSVWVANRGDGTVSRIDPKRGAVSATIRVGGFPEDVAVGPSDVWVVTHRAFAGADDVLSEREYLDAVETISNDATGLAYAALEPLYRVLKPRVRVPADLEPVPPQLGREVVAINAAQVAALSRLEPPDRFAADHARYVAGLRRLGRLHERLAHALERRQNPTADNTTNNINTFVLELRHGLSPAFRRVVPRHPLACC
jgi:YVTN family beta-propeller protein